MIGTNSMNVLLLSRYGPLGASSRIRLYQYLPYLREHGITVSVVPLFDDECVRGIYTGQRQHTLRRILSYIRRVFHLVNARTYDLVWVEQELFPMLPAIGEVLLNWLHVPFVVDFDDARFHFYELHPIRLVRALLRNKITQVMKRAALVIAGNEYLAERARQSGAPTVEIIPTVADLRRYASVDGKQASTGAFVIGWIGSPWTARYLGLVQPALAKVCEHGAARVVLVGAGPVDLPGIPLEIRPWSEHEEAGEIQRFDVGIMPLPDSPWERGKCGYKLIQYMACSKPVVASPVGVNRAIIKHGVNGFLAHTQTEWVEALNALRAQPNLRGRMGIVGRTDVERTLCLQRTAPSLLGLLRQAAGTSH